MTSFFLLPILTDNTPRQQVYAPRQQQQRQPIEGWRDDKEKVDTRVFFVRQFEFLALRALTQRETTEQVEEESSKAGNIQVQAQAETLKSD